VNTYQLNPNYQIKTIAKLLKKSRLFTEAATIMKTL